MEDVYYECEARCCSRFYARSITLHCGAADSFGEYGVRGARQ